MELSVPDMPFGMGGDPRVRPRTQASLAVTADGDALFSKARIPDTASETAANIGVEIYAGNARMVPAPPR
jgi:hypothetical protein